MRSARCLRWQPPPREPSRSMRSASITPLPIVLALMLLPSIAFASPPDPSWIAGFYDGADGDDIVSLVYETSAAKTAAPSHIGPCPCLSEISLEGMVRGAAARHFTRAPRAPPIPRSLESACVFGSLPPPMLGTEAPVTLPPITRPRRSQSIYARFASPQRCPRGISSALLGLSSRDCSPCRDLPSCHPASLVV